MNSDRWRRIEELYHAAQARPAKERAVFLDEACAGDATLRQEVESLLAQPVSTGGFLERPALGAAPPTTPTPFAAGTRLGPYEIAGPLGVGGMGEVYRARDTRLGRDVAIKILPRAFTSDPDRLARFEREARVLASLNHPNIAAIYGVEDAPADAGGHLSALVMELVEGETLGEWIETRHRAQGSRLKAQQAGLSIEEAIGLARQMADALDAAHEKGIVHRDLKPANIKITPDGVVKVLDFGLAKAGGAGRAHGAGADTPSEITLEGTREGVILGTAAYMSPEQARGQSVDKRTDIWAFGCVLYEMLTGRAAFAGQTVSDILAAILEREPDWSALPAPTPPIVRKLLLRCLEKDARRRLRDVGDVRLELEEALADRANAGDRLHVVSANRPPSRTALWVVVALLSAVAGAVVVSRMDGTAEPPAQTPARFTIQLPPGEPLGGIDAAPVALSPDGRFLAYNTTRNGRLSLYLRVLADRDPRLITESGGAYPFFSPDSQWLGFFEGGKMKKVPVRGGPSIIITDANGSRGASWGEDDFIVFAPQSRVSLSRVAAGGGGAEVLTALDLARGETSHRTPMLLPGGRAVVYRAEGITNANSALNVFSLDTKQQHVLVADGGVQPHYAATGHLLYLQGNDLMAVRLDATRLELTSTPTRVLEGVQTFSLTNTGTLVYSTGATPANSLVWVDRQGAATPLPASPQDFGLPRLSPDGRHVVLQILAGGGGNVWTYDIARDALTRLTFDGSNLWPIWTPDGDRIIYASNRTGTTWDIFSKPADGSGTETPLVTQPLFQVPRDVSTNGEWLAYSDTSSGGEDIWLRPLRGTGTARPFARTRALEVQPAFSPDSRWIAYASNESGTSEIYVRPVADGTGKWQISTNGGTEPRWNPNGREIFYRDGAKMFAVAVTAESTFVAGTPQVLFEVAAYPLHGASTNYDVSRDGKRFLMIRGERSNALPDALNVVTNWFEELRRLVPIN